MVNFVIRQIYNVLELIDFFVAPIYFAVLYLLVIKYGGKYYSKDKPLFEIFKHAFLLKIFGATFFAFIYQFYYIGGDTFCFFFWARTLNETLLNQTSIWLDYFFFNDYSAFLSIKTNYSVTNKIHGIFSCSWMFRYGIGDAFFIKLTSVIALFGANLYLPTSYLFATISFLGTWRLFLVFYNLYPNHINIFRNTIIYIPSVIFWGSGIVKDSLTFSSLGFITYAIYHGVLYREMILKRLFHIIFLSNIVLIIKGYIILSYIPNAFYWIFSEYKDKIKNNTLRLLSAPFFIIVGSIFSILIINNISSTAGRYSMDKMEGTAKDYQRWHTVASEEGSGYTLGGLDDDFSIGSLIGKFPLAVNVTLFRPYLWESRNIVMLFSAIESTLILYFTIITLLKVGLVRSLQIISSNSVIIFCLLFSILFAFAVGFTSYNFGALVRYKIPCIPFYLAAIAMIRIKSGKFS